MSDLCPNGAAEPCAGLGHSCCGEHTTTIGTLKLSKVDRVCIDKYFAFNWEISNVLPAAVSVASIK